MNKSDINPELTNGEHEDRGTEELAKKLYDILLKGNTRPVFNKYTGSERDAREHLKQFKPFLKN